MTPRRLFDRARYALALSVLVLMSALYNALASLVLRTLPHAWTRTVGRCSIASCARAYWTLVEALGLIRLDVRALDALRNDGPLLIVANHPTLFDAVVIVSRLPVVCVMKASLVDHRLFGAGARLAGYIGNAVPHSMVRQAVLALERGEQVLMFPEGTRSVGASIGPLKRGAAAIAVRAGVPIQTIFIETDTPFLRKGWPWHRMPPWPIVLRVRLGARLAPCESRDVLFARLETHLRASADVTAAIPDTRAA